MTSLKHNRAREKLKAKQPLGTIKSLRFSKPFSWFQGPLFWILWVCTINLVIFRISCCDLTTSTVVPPHHNQVLRALLSPLFFWVLQITSTLYLCAKNNKRRIFKLTHKLLWGGAFTLSHVACQLLYNSRSLKRHQRNIVVHHRLLFLTIFHRRYYIKPKNRIRQVWSTLHRQHKYSHLLPMSLFSYPPLCIPITSHLSYGMLTILIFFSC